jgi:hypothetical protein
MGSVGAQVTGSPIWLLTLISTLISSHPVRGIISVFFLWILFFFFGVWSSMHGRCVVVFGGLWCLRTMCQCHAPLVRARSSMGRSSTLRFAATRMTTVMFDAHFLHFLYPLEHHGIGATCMGWQFPQIAY